MQQTTTTFDVAVNEIFPILAAGGAVVLVPPAAELNFERLTALVPEQGVTSSAPRRRSWRGGTRSPSGVLAGLGRLRLILTAGEGLAWSDVDRLLGRATVINGYGPTEAAVAAVACDLGQGSVGSGPIRIGRPVANYEVLIRDAAGRILGVGQPGEVCLAGPGLARGYLGRPARTAAAFVPHPLAPGASAAPATADAGGPTATSPSSAVSTIRSRSRVCDYRACRRRTTRPKVRRSSPRATTSTGWPGSRRRLLRTRRSLAVGSPLDGPGRRGVRTQLAVDRPLRGPDPGSTRRMLRGERPESSPSALVPPRPRGSRPPFFCVHGIDGTVVIFRDLARAGLRAAFLHPADLGPGGGGRLHAADRGPGWAVSRVGAPGPARGSVSARQLVVRLCGRLRDGAAARPGRRARRLAGPFRRRGSGRSRTPAGDAELLVEHLRLNEGRNVDLPREEMAQLSPEESLQRVVARAWESGLLTPELDPERLQRLLAGCRARSASYRAYRPELFPGRMAFFRARPAAAGPAADDDWARAWSRLTPELDAHEVAGTHVLMFREPAVRDLADKLRLAINEAVAAP